MSAPSSEKGGGGADPAIADKCMKVEIDANDRG